MYIRLLLLSIASGALYALLGVRSDARASDRLFSAWYQPVLFEQSIDFFAIWLALSVLYAAAIRITARRKGSGMFVMIFATSALFRLALFLGNGFDDSQIATFLQDRSPLSTLVGNDRLVATIVDLGSLALALPILRSAGMPSGAALIHGWNPLVVKEVAGSGRIEALALFLLLLSIRLAQSSRLRGFAAIAYGACLNGPLFLLVSFFTMVRALRLFTLVAAAIGIAGWAFVRPEVSLDWPPSNFLGGSITPVMVALSALLVTRVELVPIVFVLAVWLTATLVRAWRWSGDAGELPRELLFALGGWIFVSPQVLPWTFLVVGYLAPYTSNRGWIVFTATAPLTYLALGGEGWSFWLGFAQYFVAYVALIFFWLGSPPSRTAG